MRIGILGTGMIVKALMKTIGKLDFEKVLVLGTEQTEAETKQICEENHLDGYVLDYEKMLDSDLDTIYVALPNHLHYSFAKKALEHKKHVIIEKPVAANVKQLKELMHLAKEQQCMMFEAMNIHYMPAYLNLKENLKQISDIKIVSLNYSQYSSRYDAFKRGEILAAFDPEKAGGALMDLNVYNVHAVVGLFGRPQRVEYLANVERGIDTSGILMLDYGCFKVSAVAAKDCKAPVRCTIQGTDGVFVIPKPLNQIDSWELMKNNGESAVFDLEEKEHRLYYEFKAFQKMIADQDWKRQEEMLEISLIVSEILEEGRRQNQIRTEF